LKRLAARRAVSDNMEAPILVVDDQPEVRDLLEDLLKRRGHQVETAAYAEAALDLVTARPDEYALVILDLDFGEGRVDGLEALQRLKVLAPDLPVVMLSGKGTTSSVVQAIKLGAEDFIEKDAYMEEQLDISMEKAARLLRVLTERRRIEARASALQRERDFMRQQLLHGYEVVWASRAMAQVMETVRQVASLPRPVLIVGERGTGKELVAAAIHQDGARRDGPFVTINCAALAEGLLECELFGQEENAFDGAPFKHGRFEIADGGTLFLDEIGNMSLDFQAKILRVIEYQRFERVQGTDTLEVDVRIVAATNTDLRAAIEQGRFRDDLYDRLSGWIIEIPPLRERRDDIVPLARHFIERFAEEIAGIEPKELSAEAIELLERHDWPGNARELKNVIEGAVCRAEGDTLEARHLPLELRRAALEQPPEQEGGNFETSVEQYERRLLLDSLEAHDWTYGTQPRRGASAAWSWRCGRSGLWRRLRRLGRLGFGGRLANFLADLWEPAQQVVEVHSGERLHDRRQLGDDLCDVVRNLAGADPAVAATSVDHDDPLGLGQRLGNGCRHGRQDLDDLLGDGRLVVVLPGFGLLHHGFGLREALLLGDFGLGQSLRANNVGLRQTFGSGGCGLADADALRRLGLTFGLCDCPLPFRTGQGFDAVALGISRLLDLGFELTFLALDLPHLDLGLHLLLNDLDLHLLLLHLLLGGVFLHVVGQIRLGLLRGDRGLVLRRLGLVVPLSLPDLGFGHEPRGLPFLVGLRRTGHGIPLRFGLTDGRVALDLCGSRLAQGVQIALIVADIADGKGHDTHAHVGHVRSGLLLHALGELVSLLVD